jgi:hypothetical protein
MAWELTGNAGTNPANNLVGTTDNQPLVIKTNGTEALFVDALQNVGIGTPNPQVRTQLEGAVDPQATLAITRSDNPKFMRLGVGTVGVALDFDSTSPFVIQKNLSGVGGHLVGQELLRVTPDGQVGIGTANPQAQLDVGGFCIINGANGGLAQLLHQDGNPHVDLVANGAPENSGGGIVHVFNAAGAGTIRLDGDGGRIDALSVNLPHAVVTGTGGGLVQLFHPNGGDPHIELIANETAPQNTGGGLVNIRDGEGNGSISLDGQNSQINLTGGIALPHVRLWSSATGGAIQAVLPGSGLEAVGLGVNTAPGGGGGVIEVDAANGHIISQLLQNADGGADFGLFANNGHFYLHLGMNAENGGIVEGFGADGNETVRISTVMGQPDSGGISIFDSLGIHTASMTFDADGNSMVVADVKSFTMPHPTQPDRLIVYACIEGPEAAVFVRGTAPLVHGEATVSLPDHFVHVANAETMTVQVTPLSADSMGLAVVAKERTGFIIRELQHGSGNYDFDWEVKCVRQGHEDFRVTRLRNEMVIVGAQARQGQPRHMVG